MADKAIWLIVLLISYSVVGTIAMNRWQKRRQKRLPWPSRDADPMSWLSYWLPPLIVVEVYALLAGAIAYAYMAIVIIAPLQSAIGFYFILGGVIGLGFFALFFAAIDALFIVSARRRARIGRPSADSSPLALS
jgi:hypothetical protein